MRVQGGIGGMVSPTAGVRHGWTTKAGATGVVSPNLACYISCAGRVNDPLHSICTYDTNLERIMSETKEHLKEAFAGESQANQKYRAFAKKAERDGFPNIAKLFRTTAEAERIHAEGHLAALEGIGSTVDNLKTAIDGETWEYQNMYPPMLEVAEAAAHRARTMFGYAIKAEEVHARLYEHALKCAAEGRDLDVSEFYLCPVCGHIEFGTPTDCPICGLKAEKFITV
jgi:rubrerythrin